MSWGTTWSSISALQFKNDGNTIKITGEALTQNIATAGSSYTKETGGIFAVNNGFLGTSASAGKAIQGSLGPIASFTVKTGTTEIAGIVLSDKSSQYTLGIENASINVGLGSTDDNIVLGTGGAITGLTAAKDGSSGVDVIKFGGSDGAVTIGTAMSIKSGNLTFQNADASTVFKLNEKSYLGQNVKLTNKSGKFTLENASSSVSLFGESKGAITVTNKAGDTKAHIGKWDIAGGSLTFDKDGTSISALTASGGTFVLGKATIGGGSTLTNLVTASSAKLVAAANGTVAIKDLSITGLRSGYTSFSIDLSESTVTSAASIGVKKMDVNVYEKLSEKATTELSLSGVGEGKYFIAEGKKGSSAIASIAGGSNMVLDGASALKISTKADSVTDWNIKDMTGKVTVVASAGADKVTIGAASLDDGAVVSLGGGADSIKLGSTADRPANIKGKVTVIAGEGDDIFDISGADPTADAKGFYVADFGSGLSKNSAAEEKYGFDKIFIGSMALDTSAVTVKSGTVDSSKKVIVVNGVEFNVNDNQNGYVQIGSGTSISNAKWTTYAITGTGLATVESASASIESLTAGEGYNLADSVSTAFKDESRKAESTVTITTADSVASAINESLATAEGDKYLEVGSQKFDDVINMGEKGTNIVEFGSGSKANGTINKGTAAATVAFTDNTVDLSDVTIKGFNSTKDTMVANVNLDKYLEDSVTSGFADSLGAYGKDVVADNGGLKATTVSGGLYKTNFREAVVQNGQIVATNNEVAVVTGAAEASKGNFSSEKNAIFAILDNNGVGDSVAGSNNNDVFVVGKGDSVNGGAGDDIIAMKGADATVVLASGQGTGNDTVTGMAEGVGTLKLAGTKTADSLSVTFDDNGFALATDSLSSTRFVGTTPSEDHVDGVYNAKISDKNGDYDALLINTNSTDAIVLGAKADSANLFVGAEGGTALVDFGNTGKTVIHLAEEDPDDATKYSNIRYVKASSKGGSQLYGGGKAASTLVAAGANDSLWGGLESQKDSLVSASGETTFFGTTKGSGNDTISNFQFGSGEGADVLILMDGTDNSTFKVTKDAVVVGSSKDDNLTIRNDAGDGVVDIGFRLGTEDSVVSYARADVGEGTIDFANNVDWYLGQGETTTLELGKGAVTLGYQSGNGSINVGTLNGKNTAAGSVINGGVENANVVYASENGASSIAGGFDGNWKEKNADTLIGGGNGNTMYYVGKDMGNDVIQNVTDGDKIVFLGTKIGDITNDLSTISGTSFAVEFGDTSKVSINTKNDVSTLKNVTIYFDDKQAVWNGTGFNVTDK